ncbi:MAG TPA: AraC family transcriptional regulator, partial [Tepidisphaeraceae bacterium]|nr:AraC family transcriptional regulator [Tepidisphaeraceae bacterium]
ADGSLNAASSSGDDRARVAKAFYRACPGVMKIITRAHLSVTHRNRPDGGTFAASARDPNHVNGRATPPAKPSSNAVNDNGPALSAGQFAVGLTESRRQGFLPIAAGRSENASGLPQRATSEREIIIFYCIKGRGWCEVEEKRHEVLPGQLLVMPAQARRTYGSYWDGSWSLIWIQLAAINLDAFASELSAAPQILSLGTCEKAHMVALFQEVLQALETPCPQRLLQVSQRAMHLLNTPISNHQESWLTETDSAGKIARTVDYMKQHLNEPLRAATLAGVAKMSLPHYFALFKRVVGSSPIDYLIRLRMEHARRLLAETSWSVKEVAVSLGYDDPLYFSRVFKSINQTAPSDFRARKRDGNGG